MTEEELAMKETLKVFNFSDEEIIRRTKEAREKNAELKAEIDAATTIILTDDPNPNSGNIALKLIGVVVGCIGGILIAKTGVIVGLSVAIFGLILVMLGMTKEERNSDMFGDVNEAILCPHCKEKGSVRTKNVNNKKGISGEKQQQQLSREGFPY